jgi:hypothetical protein
MGKTGMTHLPQASPRRLLGEACVHRADAAAALDTRYELDPETAVAAIEDWLDTMTSRG